MGKRNSSSLKWKAVVPQIVAQAGDVIRVRSGKKTTVYKCDGDIAHITKGHHLLQRQQKHEPFRPQSRRARRNTKVSGQ